MTLELVKTTTGDGWELDGSLATPPSAEPPSCNVQAAILVHGVAGNFYNERLLAVLEDRLLQCGVAVLRANTRGHDWVNVSTTRWGPVRHGSAYETADDCRHDLTAWFQLLGKLGYQRILTAGYSLGALKALYASAHESRLAVTRLVAISPPRLCHEVFASCSRADRFKATLDEAERRIAAGEGESLMWVDFPVPLLISPNTYMDKHGPASRYDLLRFASRVRCPHLMMFGQKELTPDNPAFFRLVETLNSDPPHSQRDIDVIPSADHTYDGKEHEVAERIVRWLSKPGQRGSGCT